MDHHFLHEIIWVAVSFTTQTITGTCLPLIPKFRCFLILTTFDLTVRELFKHN